jgi:tetratricopeptide (TPR) repeat protein
MSDVLRQFSFQSLANEDGQEEGRFVFPVSEIWNICEDRFDLLLGRSCPSDQYLETLQNIIKLEPNFLDAYVHLSLFFLDSDLDKAEKYCLLGLEQVFQFMPANFSDLVQWLYIENRPFLRLHNAFLTCLLRQGRNKKFVRLAEQHLAWNPSDNLGVRLVIGDACLMLGMVQKARTYFENIMEYYPPAAYSLALLEYNKGRHIEAVTALRLGVACNVYVAEGLTGRLELSPHFYRHTSSYRSTTEADSYLKHALNMWRAIDGAIDFCDWVFNCSKVLLERAKMMEWRENLTYVVDDYDLRVKINDQISVFLLSIDVESSKDLVRKVNSLQDKLVWPWEYPDR